MTSFRGGPVKYQLLGFGILAVLACLFALANGQSTVSRRAVEASSVDSVNFGRSTFNVLDFGADPTGSSDSTMSFQAAFNAATGVYGAKIIAPAGTYLISNTILVYNQYQDGTGGGPSLVGAGEDSTILEASSASADVFASCPAWVNVRPTAPPSGCPALPTWTPNAAGTGSSTPGNQSSALSGLHFQDFAIEHVNSLGSPSQAIGGSDFDFPCITQFTINRIRTTGAWNELDIGDYNPGDWSRVTVQNSAFSFAGHFMALHGPGSQLTVENNLITGDVAGGVNPYNSVVMDTSDTAGLIGGIIGAEHWEHNDLEGVSWGWFYLLPAVVQENNSFWSDNICNDSVYACFLLKVAAGSTPQPLVSGLSIRNPQFTSGYSAIDLDGGGYPGLISGCCDVGIVGGGVLGDNQLAGVTGTAQAFFLIQGKPAAGDEVALSIYPVWNAGHPTPSPFAYVVTAGSGDTAQSLAQSLASGMTNHYASTVSTAPPYPMCSAPSGGGTPTPLPYQAIAWQPTPDPVSCPAGYGSRPPPVVQAIGSTLLASPNFGLVELKMWTPPPCSGCSNPAETFGKYEVTVVSSPSRLTVAEPPSPRCSTPPNTYPVGGVAGTSCFDGSFDPGDGIAIKNGATSVEIANSRVQSGNGTYGGAAIHAWSGQHIHAFGNVLGKAGTSSPLVGIWIDSTVLDVNLSGNDLTGALYPVFYVGPGLVIYPPGGQPVIRSNFGALASVTAATTLPTYYVNNGPFDCTFFITGSTPYATATIQYAGTAAPITLPQYITAIFIPVGGIFTSTSSMAPGSWSGMCSS